MAVLMFDFFSRTSKMQDMQFVPWCDKQPDYIPESLRLHQYQIEVRAESSELYCIRLTNRPLSNRALTG